MKKPDEPYERGKEVLKTFGLRKSVPRSQITGSRDIEVRSEEWTERDKLIFEKLQSMD